MIWRCPFPRSVNRHPFLFFRKGIGIPLPGGERRVERAAHILPLCTDVPRFAAVARRCRYRMRPVVRIVPLLFARKIATFGERIGIRKPRLKRLRNLVLDRYLGTAREADLCVLVLPRNLVVNNQICEGFVIAGEVYFRLRCQRLFQFHDVVRGKTRC